MTAPQPVITERDELRKSRNLRATVLVLLIFLPFLIQAIAYLKILLRLIVVRNDVLNPEGAIIYSFLTALRTGKLYSSPMNFPWNEQMYGPVFYSVGAVLAKVAHGDPMLTTMLARIVSFLAYLGAVGLIGYMSWKLEGRKRWTAVCVVLGLACVWAIPFSASARPDTLSIFFILGALAAYEGAYDAPQGRSRLIFFAGVLGALGCLTKQSTAPLLLALALDSLIARRFRDTAALIAGSAATCALIFSVLWFRHEPFLANFTAVGHALFSWSTVPQTAINMMRVNQIAIIPIGIAMVGAARSWKKERYRMILLAAALGWISNVAALANTGATANYLMLPWLLTILLVPAGLERIEESAQRSWWAPAGLILLGAVILIHQRSLLVGKPADDLDISRVERLQLLSTNTSYLELHSSQPQLMDAYYYHQLALQERWSNAPIARKIDGEEYDLILLGGEDGHPDSEYWVGGFRGTAVFGDDTLAEIRSHYRDLCEVPGNMALVPRDRPDSLQVEDIARIFGQTCRATERIPQVQPGLR